jgi:hypothetical protein
VTIAWLAIAIGLALIGAALAPRVAVLAAALALTTCGPRANDVAAISADRVAVAANAATTSLAEAYALRGEMLVAAAHTRGEAMALLADHRRRWTKVWEAVDAMAAAHDLLATAIEQGAASPEAAAALLVAYCDLVREAKAVDAQVPAVAGLPACEVAP